MIRVLVLYFTRGGHTAKIASAIADQLKNRGAQVDLVDINSAAATRINWPDYQVVALGLVFSTEPTIKQYSSL